MGDLDAADVRRAVAAIAEGFAAQRGERQQRVGLERADLDALAGAGCNAPGSRPNGAGCGRTSPPRPARSARSTGRSPAVTRRWP